MCTEKNNNRFLKNLQSHINNWHNLYKLIGQSFVLLALIVGFWGISISREALSQTEEALKIQRDEFYIRNRPFINITDMEFSGPSSMQSGNHYKHTVQFKITNATSIPANSMIIEAKATLNNTEIRKTVFGVESLSSDIGLHALPPNASTGGKLAISQHEYEQSQFENNRFTIEIEIKYSGILGTKEDAYVSTYKVIYSVVEKKFKMMESKYI